MNRSLWKAWIVFLALPAASGADLRVRLYVHAPVSRATLEKAIAAAAYVLKQAGVRISWAECRSPSGDPPRDAACEAPVRPLDLHLRIVDSRMANQLGGGPHRLGYAWLAPGFDSIAAVYLHRAAELAQGGLADRAAILGCMLAHEIGHLLLDTSRHSERGIMRPFWGDADLRNVAKGQMLFTAEQSQRLRRMVEERERAMIPPDPTSISPSPPPPTAPPQTPPGTP